MSLIVASQDEYEDLLGLWSDLESGLAMLLTHPDSAQEFAQRVLQYDQWLQALLKQDADVGLYLLFQLATGSLAGYSAAHALVCAVLCHLIAADFALPQAQRDSLVHAALTMNVAMTALQNDMAVQTTRPTPEQQALIDAHALQSARLLEAKGIDDALWLETVQYHHAEVSMPNVPLSMLAPSRRLAYILQVVDRYAAMISPRESREGRNASESANDILQGGADHGGAVAQALVRVVGLCPPGTFVQLDNEQIAVVARRGQAAHQPIVAVVMEPTGVVVRPPFLLQTAADDVDIRSALLSSAVPERINHQLILKLGNAAAQAVAPA